MFNWLQHLFTARALQLENAQLTAKIAELEVEAEEYKKVVAIKDEEISRLKYRSSNVREVNVATRDPRR